MKSKLALIALTLAALLRAPYVHAVAGFGPLLNYTPSSTNTPPAGYNFWLNTGSITNVGSSSISWADTSGSGLNFTMGYGTPSNFSAGTVNSLSTLLVGGGNSNQTGLLNANTFGFGASNTADTLAIGIKYTDTSGSCSAAGPPIWGFNSASSGNSAGITVCDNGGNLEAFCTMYRTTTSIAYTAHATGGAVGSPHVIIARFNGVVTITCSIDGGTPGTATLPGSTGFTNSGDTLLFYNGAASTSYLGHIFEVVNWGNSTVSTSAIASYFATKWGT